MSDNLSLREQELEREVRRSLQHHWRLFLLQGALLIAAGAAAIVVPQVASVAAAFFIGWLLIAAGVTRAAVLISASQAPGYWQLLLISALAVLLGTVLVLDPAKGALTLTMVLAAYFVLHGLASFVLAYALCAYTDSWPWLLLSGLVDLVLAGIIVAGWPGTAEWVPGLLVGVNMLFTGMVLAFAAAGARMADE
jgi:uncharacterized membrane protein HdeD (DUF308 family)